MKNLPIGIQTFRDFNRDNYLYVDKTRSIYQLFANGGKYYFMSRPRRFGKSLLISTLKEIFAGNREYFKGLWIYDKLDWKEHPVIHLDFSRFSYDSPEELKKSLEKSIRKMAAKNGIQLDADCNYKDAFADLIEEMSVKGRVVILIDEYDKPIIDNIHQEKIATANRNVLREFFAVIKATDEFNRFAFITGISKFSKVSVFSGLNNLIDISVDEKHATLLGYTEEELLHYFGPRIKKMAVAGKGSEEGILKQVKEWYDGYSWDGKQFVYNPYSVLIFFLKERLGNYWFESGTPAMLVKLIKDYQIDVKQLEHYKAGESVFNSFDIQRLHVVSLLFQTGYLTVKDTEPVEGGKFLYVLSYPNLEVKESLLELLLGEFSSRFTDEISVLMVNIKKSLVDGDIDRFFDILKTIFAGISYDSFVADREGFYQTVIYLILKLTGINILTEIETNQGRIDALIQTEDNIYILEFKLGSAEEALKQIKDKKYAQPYRNSGKKIIIAGVGFDMKERNIGQYLVEIL